MSQYITPGSYVYEGMIVSLFNGDTRTVVAYPGSDFFYSLDCNITNVNVITNVNTCNGTVEQYCDNFFGGEFKFERTRAARDAIILGAFLIIARVATFFALKYLRFTST